MRKRTIYVLVSIAALLAVLFALSQGGDYTQKGIAQALIDETSNIRSKIKESLEVGSLSKVLVDFNKSQSKVEGFSMLDDGTFMVANMRYKVIILFKPSIRNTKITWQCTGLPEVIVRIQCDRNFKEEQKSMQKINGVRL